MKKNNNYLFLEFNKQSLGNFWVVGWNIILIIIHLRMNRLFGRQKSIWWTLGAPFQGKKYFAWWNPPFWKSIFFCPMAKKDVTCVSLVKVDLNQTWFNMIQTWTAPKCPKMIHKMIVPISRSGATELFFFFFPFRIWSATPESGNLRGSG